MTENDYIDQIWQAWPDGDVGVPDTALMTLMDDALEAFPSSAELWVMQGDLLVLADNPRGAHESYNAALAIAPCNIDAIESLAFLLDVSFGRQVEAEQFFRRAIELGGSPDTYAGLARLLAETNRKSEAIMLLTEDSCSFATDETVVKMRTEIVDGVWDNS